MELKAIFLGLKVYARDVRDSTILIRSDNTVALSMIRNFGAPNDSDLNFLAREIWLWAFDRKLFLQAVHIPGKENVRADRESRSHKDTYDWKLDPTLVRTIFRHWGQPDIDLFASRLTKQLPLFYSFFPDPEALAADAFAQSWSGRFVYAFPPFSLLGRVLQKVRQDCVEAIVISPKWPSHPAWSTLMEMSIDPPLLLHRTRNYLTNPRGEDHELLSSGSFLLLAWRISYDVGKTKDFRKKLLGRCSNRGHQIPGSNMTPHLRNGIVGVCQGTPIPLNLLSNC